MSQQDSKAVSKSLLTVLTLLAAVFLSTFFFIPSTTALNDSIAYYSFENYPDFFAYDDTGNDQNLTLNAAIPYNALFIGYWATYFDENQTASGDLVNTTFLNSSGGLGTGLSFVYWIQNLDVRNGMAHFSIGDGLQVYMYHWSYAGNSLVDLNIYMYDATGTGYRSCDTNAGGSMQGFNWTDGSFDFIGFTIPADSSCPTHLWVNDNSTLNTFSQTTAGGFRYMSFTDTELILSGDPNGLVTDPQDQTVIDEFGIYNRSLTTNEYEELYQNGSGYSPYSAYPPILISPIGTLNMLRNDVEVIDISTWFAGEVLGSGLLYLEFTYDGTTYNLSDNGSSVSANAGDFSVWMYDEYMILYSFGEAVYTPMTLYACNSNGCTDAPFYYRISGYAIPTLITEPGDWQIVEGQSDKRYLSDYFGGYDELYTEFHFINPDTGSVVELTRNNKINTNSCFTATLNTTEGSIEVEGLSACQTSYIFYACDATICDGNTEAYLRIIDAESISGSGMIGYFSNFLNVFPDSDNLNNTTKSLIVFIFVITIIVGSVFLVREGADAKIVGIGSAVAMFFLLIFFTAIGYIPIWIIIMLFLLLTVLGIGFMRSRVMGV